MELARFETGPEDARQVITLEQRPDGFAVLETFDDGEGPQEEVRPLICRTLANATKHYKARIAQAIEDTLESLEGAELPALLRPQAE